MCFFSGCLGSSRRKNHSDALIAMDPQAAQDYDDVRHLSQKRDIKVTIRKGTQAGVAAGLSVMAGVIVAGPVGAAIGGSIGTAIAMKMAQNVVPLNQLLEETPAERRLEILNVFQESFREEFMETINGSPELRLMMSGTSIFGVVRYMMDRNILESEQLERLDKILQYVT